MPGARSIRAAFRWGMTSGVSQVDEGVDLLIRLRPAEWGSLAIVHAPQPSFGGAHRSLVLMVERKDGARSWHMALPIGRS
jgi:hypothetical protein